jgi:cobalt/nickel transport system ATP-binding protein
MSAPAIQFRDYHYHYPDGTTALRGIDLAIAGGEKVAFIGPNGAGKSTLLLAIAGFASGSGSLHINGLEQKRSHRSQIRRQLGCCLENPDDQLFMPRLWDDVAFGPINEGLHDTQVRERVTQALERVDLLPLADRPPHHLSAGQKRRAALASVLAMRPAIITLDEPDASLDPRSRRELERLLQSLEQTLIVATCNMRFAFQIAERAVLVDDGTVVADGPKEEIMLDGELMERHGLESPGFDI